MEYLVRFCVRKAAEALGGHNIKHAVFDGGTKIGIKYTNPETGKSHAERFDLRNDVYLGMDLMFAIQNLRERTEP